MEGGTIALAAVGVLFSLLAARVPIAFALLVVSITGIFVIGATQLGSLNYEIGAKYVISMLSRDPYSFVASFSLMAIPMFLLMGNLAYRTGATASAYRSARVWLGGLPGGLAVASIAASALFAAISGSSVACAAAMGRIAVPEMLRYGYQKGLAAGVVAAGGTLGALIPPSILMVIYGIFAEQSIGQLLMGGVGPGLLTVIMYIFYVVFRVKVNPSLAPQTHDKHTWNDRFGALNGTWQLLLVFAVVMSVIYLGVATPTEAAAIGAMAILVIGALRHKLGGKELKDSLRETVAQTAMIFAIAIASKLLAAFVALTGVSENLAEWASTIESGRMFVLLGICLIYILLGCFLDPIGILLLTLPVVIPVVDSIGYNLIWFGVLLVKLLEIGMITPPVGLNVFVLKGAIGKQVSLEQIFRGIGGFLIMDIFIVALMISYQDIVLWLPSLMRG